jgi:hypothetical protein
MSPEHKEYHPHPLEPENENSKIKFAIYYEKGKKYWISVIPVKITKKEGYSMEEFGAYTGFRQTLIECNRKSKKTLDTAIKLMNEKREDYLNYFNKVNNENRNN